MSPDLEHEGMLSGRGDDESFREYGRQIAMDSLMTRALTAGERRARRFTWPLRVAAAACIAVIAGAAAYHFYQARLFRERVVAHIENTSSGVSIDRDSRPVTAGKGMPLAVGDRIETAGNQEMSFTYSGEETRVLVRDNTTLVLERAADGKRLSLRRGEIEADVASQREGRRMRVVTPHAEMAVLGTVFSVTASADTTGLSVREGTVRMTASGGDRGEDVGDGRVAFAKTGLNRVIVPGRFVRSMPITGLPPGAVVSGIALAAKEVWVHGSSGGDRAPILVSLDAATGTITGKLELSEPFMPASCITWKKNLLWGFTRDGMSLQGVEVRTGAVVRTISLPVAETSSQRIFDIQGEFAWLRGKVREEVIKIDLRSGAVVARIMCPFAVDRIAASADAVYAGEDGWTVCKIDPHSGQIAYRFMCEAESVTGDMALDGASGLWAVAGSRAVVYVFEAE